MTKTLEDQLPARVMIVEDEGIIARDIERILTRLGYEVVGQAASGTEALATLGMVRADVALMDIKIKGDMDGIQTAALAWQRHHLPVVFLTAHADRNTLRRATETAPFGYVVKPFTEASIQVALEVALSRFRLQQKAEDHQSWLHIALQSLGDAVLVTDFDGRITFLNGRAEEFLGCALPDALGRQLDQIAPLVGTDGSELGEWVCGVAPDEPVVCSAVSLEGQRGHRVEVVASVSPLRKPKTSEIRGCVIMLRPVSTPVLLPPVEPDENKRLRELSFAITHDLREPVRNIGCFAQLLERRELSSLDSDSREYLRYIIEGSRKMDGLLLGLHRYQYANEAQRELNAFTSAEESLKRALTNLSGDIRRTETTVLSEPLPNVACTTGVLAEIFEILLSNSIRFRSDRELEVQVSSVPCGLEHKFCIQDNGLGIEVEQQTRVFQPFRKAHPQSRSGAGLGLSIAKRFVELYGGSIWLDSRPGEGTVVSFTLPRAA